MPTDLQIKISKLQGELSALQNDASYKQDLLMIAAVYSASGNKPYDKNGNFCWISGGTPSGTYWCDSSSNTAFLAARSRIAAQDALIANKKNELKPLLDEQTAIDTATASASATATGKTSTEKWLFFGLIALIIIGAAVYMIFRMTQIRKLYVIGGAIGLLIVAYLIFFGIKKTS